MRVVTIPNELFFGSGHTADLSKELDDQRKTDVPVQPLIEILTRYKFTVEENTPLEQEIALDPELLGQGVRKPARLLQRRHEDDCAQETRVPSILPAT